MEPREQFTFYRSFWEALKALPKKDQLPFVTAVCAYALDGESKPLSGSPYASFLLVKPILDKAAKKSANGKQGGSKPKANGKKGGSNQEQNESHIEGEKEVEKEIEVEIENDSLYITSSSEDVCAEPKIGSAPEPAPPVICMPLNDGSEFGVTAETVTEFTSLYPALDIMQELRNMRGWLLNNPKNRKTKAGICRFINAWLSRSQDSARRTAPNRQASGNVFLDIAREEGIV